VPHYESEFADWPADPAGSLPDVLSATSDTIVTPTNTKTNVIVVAHAAPSNPQAGMSQKFSETFKAAPATLSIRFSRSRPKLINRLPLAMARYNETVDHINIRSAGTVPENSAPKRILTIQGAPSVTSTPMGRASALSKSVVCRYSRVKRVRSSFAQRDMSG